MLLSKMQDGGGHHFKLLFNGYNLVGIEYTGTKFETEIKTDVLKAVLPSDLASDKIQDGGGRHFEIQFIGYNSVATACVCT